MRETVGEVLEAARRAMVEALVAVIWALSYVKTLVVDLFSGEHLEREKKWESLSTAVRSTLGGYDGMGLSRNRCIDGRFGSTTEQTGMSWRPSIPECYMPNHFRLLPVVANCMRPTKSLSGSTSRAFGRGDVFGCSTFMTPLRCCPRC